MDDQDSSDEELLRRQREAAGTGEGSSRQVPESRHSGYSWGVFDDDMQARVNSSRPPEYSTWESYQQSIYDQNSRLDETRNRQHEEYMAHSRNVERVRHIDSQMELNMRAYDENQYRRHLDYYAGVPYVENPPYVDYSTQEPYQPGMPRHPSPQVHGSMWLPQEYTQPHYQSSYPYQPPPYEYPQLQQQQQEEQGDQGAGGIFDMSAFYEHLGDYYGRPPGPSYR